MSYVEDRDAVLARGNQLWDKLRASLDAHLLEPVGADTDWTGREVYAHFARWQAKTIADLRGVLAGRHLAEPEENENVLNDRWRAEDRTLDTGIVIERCLSSRVELRALLMSLRAEQWRTFGHLFAPDINGEHYEHHLIAIRASGTVS